MQIKVNQVIPLALLYATDGHRIKGRTRFQKLAFLTQEKLAVEGVDLYEFIEYDYGPFSKELLDDLEMFEKRGLVKIDENRTFGGKKRYDYELSDEGIESFEENLDHPNVAKVHDTAKDIIEQYNSMSLRRLLNFIYDEYPRFEENSVYRS